MLVRAWSPCVWRHSRRVRSETVVLLRSPVLFRRLLGRCYSFGGAPQRRRARLWWPGADRARGSPVPPKGEVGTETGFARRRRMWGDATPTRTDAPHSTVAHAHPCSMTRIFNVQLFLFFYLLSINLKINQPIINTDKGRKYINYTEKTCAEQQNKTRFRFFIYFLGRTSVNWYMHIFVCKLFTRTTFRYI
jgi:hypothetical protein